MQIQEQNNSLWNKSIFIRLTGAVKKKQQTSFWAIKTFIRFSVYKPYFPRETLGLYGYTINA